MKGSLYVIPLMAGFVLSASAQEQPTAHPPSTSEFADKAAVINRFEIQAGNLAQKKSDSDEVDQYAKMIVQDHKKALDKLNSVVGKLEDVSVPASLDQAHASMLHQLKMSSGKQFTSTFKLQQVEGHKQAILLTEAYAQSGDNAQLKKWAQQQLPALRKHLAHAQQLPPASAQSIVVNKPGVSDQTQAKQPE